MEVASAPVGITSVAKTAVSVATARAAAQTIVWTILTVLVAAFNENYAEKILGTRQFYFYPHRFHRGGLRLRLLRGL